MKNLKILTIGILLVSMSLTSCKKDADQQVKLNTPSENKENLFEKSITIYNADKTKSATLRFSAASKKALENAGLDKLEFTLVKTPESAEATDLATSTIQGDDMGYVASSSAKNAPQSTNEEQDLPGDPGDAIQVDLPNASQTEPTSIEVKSKDLNNGTMRSATEQVQAPYWWNRILRIRSKYHKMKVHYYGYNHIDVYWYWHYSGSWHYSGYSQHVYHNQNAWGWSCTYWTGVDIYYHTPAQFTVTFYRSC